MSRVGRVTRERVGVEKRAAAVVGPEEEVKSRDREKCGLGTRLGEEVDKGGSRDGR